MSEVHVRQLERHALHREARRVRRPHDVSLTVDPGRHRATARGLLDAEGAHGVEVHRYPGHRRRIETRAVGHYERGLRCHRHVDDALGEQHGVEDDARVDLPRLELAAEREAQRKDGGQHDRPDERDAGRFGVGTRRQADREHRVAVHPALCGVDAGVAGELGVHALEPQRARERGPAHRGDVVQRTQRRYLEHEDIGHANVRARGIDGGRGEPDLPFGHGEAVIHRAGGHA